MGMAEDLAQAQERVRVLEGELASIQKHQGLNRHARKAQVKMRGGFLKLTPMFRDASGKMVEHATTYTMHTKVKDVVVAVVDASTITAARAKHQEQALMDFFKTDVLVLSDNVRLMKLELVPAAEAAAMLRPL